MRKFGDIIDAGVLVAILVCCGIYMFDHRVRGPSTPDLHKVAALTSADRQVVVALSTQCHFCTESVGFYGRMIKAASQKGLPVVLLFRKSEATRDVNRYVQENGLGYASAIPVDFSSLGIDGTPTLIFYRSKAGAQLFTGKLSTQEEDRILGAIQKL
jgi:hypothetical protein